MNALESVRNLIRLRSACRLPSAHFDERVAFKLASEAFIDEHGEQLYEMLKLLDPGEPCGGQ